MTKPTQSPAEDEVKSLLAAGDSDGAVTSLIRHYGPELLAFLNLRLRDTEHARDAFAWLAEDLWRGMKTFRGDSAVRTWAYAIARNVAWRYADRELRKRLQDIPISEVSRASALAVKLETHTERNARVEALKAQLDDEERTLLTLRLDRDMDWKEIATIMLYDGTVAADQDLTREAARLRQRYQSLKAKLRQLSAE